MAQQTKQLLSPRDLSRLVRLSESTLKRWIDDGRLKAFRTPGGHRRVPREEAVRLIRELGGPSAAAEAVGFAEVPSGAGAAGADADAALRDRLYDALVGDHPVEAAARVHAPFLTGRPAHEVFDGLIAPVMHRIGRLWQERDDGILLEHQATDLCLRALVRIRDALPAPGRGAFASVGAAPPGDPYLLPTQMAAVVLAELGMRPVNLGPQTPLEVLAAAAERHGARLVWLSVSTPDATEAIRTDLPAFAERVSRVGARLIVGGRASRALRAARPRDVVFGRRMAELSAFAEGLLAGAAG